MAANEDGLLLARRRGFTEFDRYTLDEDTAEYVELCLARPGSSSAGSRSSDTPSCWGQVNPVVSAVSGHVTVITARIGLDVGSSPRRLPRPPS